MKVKFSPKIIMSLCFVGFASWGIFEARTWPVSVRFFPWVTAIPLLAFGLIQLVRDLRETNGKKALGQVGKVVMDFQFSEGVEPAVARRRTVTMFAWLFIFAIAVWLVGFHIAIPLIIFLYVKWQGREGWVLSVAVTALSFAFFWGLFDLLLHLPFPKPFLLSLLEALYQ